MPGAVGWVSIDDARCRGCGLCILACPVGCLGFSEDCDDSGYRTILYSAEACLADGLCARACPRPGAIVVRAGPDSPTIESPDDPAAALRDPWPSPA